MKAKIIALILCLAMTVPTILTGCASKPAQSDDMMDGVSPQTVSAHADMAAGRLAAANFAAELLKNTYSPGENALVSPASVLCCLAMTANGAAGDTMGQFEDAFGMPIEELNVFLKECTSAQRSDDRCKVHMANAIWMKDKEAFAVKEDFLQKNADYYGAGVYKAAFDSSTLKEINDWVSDNTDGMIKNILDAIPDEAVMYLVNALSFDAEWQDIYYEHQIKDGTFTLEDGTERDAEFMFSSETVYLEDDRADGFIKPYAGGRYAFAALLPEEGLSVEEYAASLTGEKLISILDNARTAEVSARTPKFSYEFSSELSPALQEMGIVDAFDYFKADFSALGESEDGNIFISRVLHKTFISVDEKGTKAGAATIVEMADECAEELEAEWHEVNLDRPFIYMIIDTETDMPLFIGAMMDTNA